MSIRTVIPFTLISGLLAATSAHVFACGEDAYTGQVCIMAGNYCPRNTVELQGQMLTINDNQALYSLLGCTYGGDCRTNFGVPDLRGRAPFGYGQGPGLTNRPWGQKFGQEGVTPTIAMMAAHTHTAVFTPGGGGASGGAAQVNVRQATATTDVPQAGYMLGQAGTAGGEQVNTYLNPNATSGTDVALGGVSGGGGSSGGGTVTVNPTGAGMPIPTVPPSIALRYCIVTQGLYPPRP